MRGKTYINVNYWLVVIIIKNNKKKKIKQSLESYVGLAGVSQQSCLRWVGGSHSPNFKKINKKIHLQRIEIERPITKEYQLETIMTVTN